MTPQEQYEELRSTIWKLCTSWFAAGIITGILLGGWFSVWLVNSK